MLNICTALFKITTAIICCCLLFLQGNAQTPGSKNNYILNINYSGKDSSFNPQALKLQTTFNSQPQAIAYVNKLPLILSAKGYPLASVDSLWYNEAAMFINLYLGTKYQWIQLDVSAIEKKALDQSGFVAKNFGNRPLNLIQLQAFQQQLLNYYGKEGFPFASVYLDSIQISGDQVRASLKAEKGLLYHIDSIRVQGKVKLNKFFVQRYLNIANGSAYNREKLQ